MFASTAENYSLAMEQYLEAIRSDYFAWQLGREDSLSEIRANMVKTFNSRLAYRQGAKYTKVMSDNAVHSFVVAASDDPKFPMGTILKPAGVAGPTRKNPRGNIFTGYTTHWTGTPYLV